MRLKDLKQLKLNDGLGFLVRFVLVLAGGFALVYFIPAEVKDDGFSLSIIFECTAAIYIVIFTAAVIAYPASTKRRLYGLFTGLILITLLNLSRIVFLGWFGAHYPAQQLYFVHNFVWEGGFLFVVIALWVLWLYGGVAEFLSRVGRRSNLQESHEQHDGHRSRPEGFTIDIRHRVACMVFFMAIIFTTFNFLDETYMSVLAKVSGWLMYVAGFRDAIFQSEGNVLYIVFPPSRNIIGEVTFDVFDGFVFIALVICFSRARSLARLAIYLAVGVPIIMAFHIGGVTFSYMDLRDGVRDSWGVFKVLYFMIQVSPFFVWAFLNVSDIVNKDRSFRNYAVPNGKVLG
jgi:exosortase/archaeosortase family protein